MRNSPEDHKKNSKERIIIIKMGKNFEKKHARYFFEPNYSSYLICCSTPCSNTKI